MTTGYPPATARLHRQPRRPFSESSTASLAGCSTSLPPPASPAVQRVFQRQPRRLFNEFSTASLAGRAASCLYSPLHRNSQQRLSVCDCAHTNTLRWASVMEASLGVMANPATSSLGVARVPGQSVLEVKRWSTRALPSTQPSHSH